MISWKDLLKYLWKKFLLKTVDPSYPDLIKLLLVVTDFERKYGKDWL